MTGEAKPAGFLDTLLQSGTSHSFLGSPSWSPEEQLGAQRPACVVVGAPFEGCCFYRPGSSFGPQAIRLASEQYTTYGVELDLDVAEHLDLRDAGDVLMAPGNRDECHARIEAAVAGVLDAGGIPIVLGGDHSVTLPSCRAFAARTGKAGVIHFDTHLDISDTYGDERTSNCTQMLRITEMPSVDPDNVVHIGIRGWLNPRSQRRITERVGTHIFFMSDIERRGLADVVDEALALATAGTDSLYMTVDIDALDPAFAPGTCSPEPGGLTTLQLFEAVRKVSLRGVGALDLVEVAPQYDIAGITARAAVRVICEFLAGTALHVAAPHA